MAKLFDTSIRESTRRPSLTVKEPIRHYRLISKLNSTQPKHWKKDGGRGRKMVDCSTLVYLYSFVENLKIIKQIDQDI